MKKIMFVSSIIFCVVIICSCGRQDSPTSPVTGTATWTATAQDTGTETMTSTVTGTGTETFTHSSTPTFTETATFTPTSTCTPTFTVSETHSVSPTFTATGTDTQTFTQTMTSTNTPTFTSTPTVTETVGGTVVVTELAPVEDTGIGGGINTVEDYMNSGSCSTMTAGLRHYSAGGDPIMRALVRFDLTALAGKQIVSARLEVYGATYSTALPAVNLYRVGQEWVQGTACTSTGGNGATWRNTGLAPWSVYGGDYATYGLAAINGPVQTAQNSWHVFQLDPAVMQDMVSDTTKNYGFMIRSADEGTVGWFDFYTSDYNNAAYRPKLVVEHRP